MFEVASLRSNEELVPSFGPGLRNGRLTATRITVQRLLALAYGVTEPQVVGPDWLQQTHFDIVARSPEGIPDSELPAMLQALLKERFHLVAHTETRTMPVYRLSVAPGGVKMPIYPAPNRAVDAESARGFPMLAGAPNLAKNLSYILGRPVVDRTGLKERYRYFGPPDLFTAVQKQLGLKLEPAKDDVRVVLVDCIDRMPTPN